MNRRPSICLSIWWALTRRRALAEMAGLAANFNTTIRNYNQNLRALDADILEERAMRLIEKESLFSAERGAVSLIAASLVLTMSATLASAFSPSSG